MQTDKKLKRIKHVGKRKKENDHTLFSILTTPVQEPFLFQDQKGHET